MNILIIFYHDIIRYLVRYIYIHQKIGTYQLLHKTIKYILTLNNDTHIL